MREKRHVVMAVPFEIKIAPLNGRTKIVDAVLRLFVWKCCTQEVILRLFYNSSTRLNRDLVCQAAKNVERPFVLQDQRIVLSAFAVWRRHSEAPGDGVLLVNRH